MTIIWSIRFRRMFSDLPGQIKERAKKQLALFSQNPQYPSLQTKKMEGWGNIWEGRITHGWRFTFAKDGDTYTLRRIGTHDILKNP